MEKKIIFSSVNNEMQNLEAFLEGIALEVRGLFTPRHYFIIKLISNCENKPLLRQATYVFKKHNFELNFLAESEKIPEEIEKARRDFGFIFVMTDLSKQDLFSLFKLLNLGIPEKYRGPGGLDYFIFE